MYKLYEKKIVDYFLESAAYLLAAKAVALNYVQNNFSKSQKGYLLAFIYGMGLFK